MRGTTHIMCSSMNLDVKFKIWRRIVQDVLNLECDVLDSNLKRVPRFADGSSRCIIPDWPKLTVDLYVLKYSGLGGLRSTGYLSYVSRKGV